MARQQALMDLIRNLSGSEKRYFQMRSRLQEGSKNYLALFEFLCSKGEFDEAEIRDHFKGETFLRQIHVTCNYLYRQISESLIDFHRNEQGAWKADLEVVKILFRKDLLKDAWKLLARAKKYASLQEDYLSVLDCLYWERKLLVRLPSARIPLKAIGENFRQVVDTLAKVKESANAEFHFYSSVKSLYESGRMPGLKQMGAFGKQLQSGKVNPAAGFEVKYYQLNLLARFTRERGRWKESHEYRRALVQLIESRPAFLRQFPQNYSSALANLANTAIHLGRHLEAESAMQKMRDLRTSSEKLNRILQLQYLDTILSYYLELGRFASGKELLPQMISHYRNHPEEMGKSNQILYCYYIAYTYFGLLNYKESLRWIFIILRDTLPENNAEIHAAARWLFLANHADLGNSDLVVKEAGKMRLFLKKHLPGSAFERDMAAGMEQINSAENTDLVYRRLLRRVELARKNPAERKKLETFHFAAWLDHMLTGKPFAALVAEPR